MPESMNHLKELAFLRKLIVDTKAEGESTMALEALLSLGESMIVTMKPAISHIELTQPRDE